jgi:iron complex outermembrane receptor protein
VDARYIGAANINNSYTNKDLNVLSVPSVTYVNTSFTYRLRDEPGDRLEAFVRVGNLFDKDPPLTNDLFGTSPTLYDVIGRTYTAGIRLGF